MKKSLKILLSGLIVFAAVITTQISLSSTANAACSDSFLSIPAWYQGLLTADCEIMSPSDVSGGLPAYARIIAFNVVDILLNVVGYLAVFFVLYGGFQFLTSGGSSDAAAKARTTILNALIGAVISFGAMGIVNQISDMTTIGVTTPESLLKSILNTIYQLSAVIAVIVIIVAGYKMIVGGDNPNTVSSAKQSITYAVIGIIVILLAFAITNFVVGKL